MAAGRVRFGAINVPRFKYPLESRDSVLLVELRTLREIRDAIEIANREQIRSSLCSSAHDLRRNDLREMLLRQKFAKVTKDCRLNSEYVADVIIAERKRTVIEQNVRVDVGDVRCCVKRQRVGRTVQHRELNNIEFESTLCPLFRSNASSNLDSILDVK